MNECDPSSPSSRGDPEATAGEELTPISKSKQEEEEMKLNLN